jgi:hypothetical protein
MQISQQRRSASAMRLMGVIFKCRRNVADLYNFVHLVRGIDRAAHRIIADQAWGNRRHEKAASRAILKRHRD